jgi:uncharacterized protein YjbI with pentapeptide repeats
MSSDALRERVEAGDPAGFAELIAEMEEEPSLEGETFEGLRLLDFDFGGVDLSNTEWSNCDLERVRFGDANLQGAFFDHGRLTECRFDGTDLGGASFDAVLLARSELAGADVSGLEMENCQLEDCAFRDLVLEEVAWAELSGTRVTLERVRGGSGELTGLLLRDATFSDVDLSGVECVRCRASAKEGEIPAGFSPLGKRRDVR